MSSGGLLPVLCAVCGPVGKYASAAAADQMRDVHLAVHASDDPSVDQPAVGVLAWEMIEAETA